MGEVLEAASKRYGKKFAEVLKGSKVWLNGEAATRDARVGDDDEVAVLPPVSGGAGGPAVSAARRRLTRGWVGLGGARSNRSRQPAPTGSSRGPGRGRGGGSQGRGRPPSKRRYAPVHDIEGPKVRLGVLWFVGNVVALFVGLELLVPLYAATAAVAASQTVAAWRQHGQRPDRWVAIGAAALLPVAAAAGNSMLGLTLICLAAAAVVQGYANRSKRSSPAVDAGFTVQCGLFPGLAAAALVTSYRFDTGLAVGLVVLAAAYDAGDYLVGSGSSNRFEGPVAALAAMMCCTFTLSVLGVAPFEVPGGFGYGALAAALAICGPLLASATLPTVDAPAAALRRIDSLLLLAPAWAIVVAAIAI